jgi:hypothetical protein
VICSDLALLHGFLPLFGDFPKAVGIYASEALKPSSGRVCESESCTPTSANSAKGLNTSL